MRTAQVHQTLPHRHADLGQPRHRRAAPAPPHTRTPAGATSAANGCVLGVFKACQLGNGAGIQKDVFVWSTSDLSGPPTLGSSFTVTGTPDLMAFKGDEAVVQPSDYDSGNPDSFEPNQTLFGTLESQEFRGNHATTDVFEFEFAYQVTDGVNTFNVYQIHNAHYDGTTTAYVSEVALEPHTTYTVVAQDNAGNFADGDHVDDLPAGTTECIARGFIRDLNFELESGSLAFTDHTVSISGAPVEFRFVDHHGVTPAERQ